MRDQLADKGWTVTSLALREGVSEQFVRLFLSGFAAHPTLASFIADILGVSEDALYARLGRSRLTPPQSCACAPPDAPAPSEGDRRSGSASRGHTNARCVSPRAVAQHMLDLRTAYWAVGIARAAYDGTDTPQRVAQLDKLADAAEQILELPLPSRIAVMTTLSHDDHPALAGWAQGYLARLTGIPPE